MLVNSLYNKLVIIIIIIIFIIIIIIVCARASVLTLFLGLLFYCVLVYVYFVSFIVHFCGSQLAK